MAYALYSQSYGAVNANAAVAITEAVTGLPAVILSSATGGFVTDTGKTKLDSSGNLAVYIDTAKTWEVKLDDGSVAASQVVSQVKYLSAGDVAGFVGQPGITYIVSTSPFDRYVWNGTSLVVQPTVSNSGNIIGSGGALVSGGGSAVDPTAWPMRIPTVLASPPTVTAGVNGAASAIAGSVHIRGFEPGAFSFFGGPVKRGINYPQYIGVTLGIWSGTTSPSCCAVEFWLDTADATGRFEIYVKGGGGGYRVLSGQPDGSWGAFTAGASRTLPNDGGMYRDLVTMGVAGEYRMRIELSGGASFFGLQVGATDAVRPTRTPRRLIVVGDSFSEPTINDSGSSFPPADGWPQQFAHLTGYDIWTCAKGGSGYVETVPNQVHKFRTRIQEALTYDGDFLFAGGINDASDSLTEFAAEAAGCFDDVIAAGRELFVMSPFWPGGITSYPVNLLQYRDTLRSLSEAKGGTFIDVLDLGIPEFLEPYANWQGITTASVASGAANLPVDSVPAYFAIPNAGPDLWLVKIGSGASQCVRQVQSIVGSGPYTLGLIGTLPAAFSAGTPVALAGPGYLTGTGRQGTPAGNGNADRYTGPDGTHPTRLGHHNIPRIVCSQLSKALA